MNVSYEMLTRGGTDSGVYGNSVQVCFLKCILSLLLLFHICVSAGGRESFPLSWAGDEHSACLPGFLLGCAREVGGRNISRLAPSSEPPAPAGKKQRQRGCCEEVKEDVQEPVRHAGLEWRRLAVASSREDCLTGALLATHAASHSAPGWHAFGAGGAALCQGPDRQ